jgi:hypothetical protein
MTSSIAVAALQNGYSNMHRKTYPAQQLHPAFLFPPAIPGHAQPALIASARQAHNRCSYMYHHRRRERKKYQPIDHHSSTSDSTGKHWRAQIGEAKHRLRNRLTFDQSSWMHKSETAQCVAKSALNSPRYRIISSRIVRFRIVAGRADARASYKPNQGDQG